MNLWAIPCILSMGLSVTLGCLLFLKRKDSPVFAPLILIMVVMAWIHGFNGLSYLQPAQLLLYKEMVLFGEVIFPVALGFVSQSFIKHISTKPSALETGFWKIMAAGALVFLLMLVFGGNAVIHGHDHHYQN